MPDIDFDGAEDVVTRDQNGIFYCLSGRRDSVIFSQNFGNWINSVNVMLSVYGNYSLELIAGTDNVKVVCLSGGIDTTSTKVSSSDIIPGWYKLLQNYPNPFDPTTSIEFSIPQKSDISIKV